MQPQTETRETHGRASTPREPLQDKPMGEPSHRKSSEPKDFADLLREEQEQGSDRHAVLVSMLRRLTFDQIEEHDLDSLKKACQLYLSAFRLRLTDRAQTTKGSTGPNNQFQNVLKTWRE